MKKIILLSLVFVFSFLFVNISKVEAATLYYNAVIDTDWNTLTNWWTDSGFTLQASILPTISDDAIISGNISSNSGVAASVNTLDVNGTAVVRITITVAGGATFNDTTKNLGTITGDVIFNDSSENDRTTGFGAIAGTVTGNAIFNDLSYNSGEVSGNAFFYDLTSNSLLPGGSGGLISGDACFASTASNNSVVFGNETVCTPVAPTVATLITSAIGQALATLSGNISDTGIENDEISERGFNYGLTAGYGSNIIQSSAPYGAGSFTGDVSGLACGTTYHFRAYAINPTDTGYGNDDTFNTSACDAVPVVPTSSISSSGSRPKIIIPTIIETVCPQGDKYSITTGLPCTQYQSLQLGTGQATLLCSITLTLRQGNTGEQVKCLQSKLNQSESLNLSLDGIFGPITKSAVILFQQNHNLVPDGIVGPVTRGALQ